MPYEGMNLYVGPDEYVDWNAVNQALGLATKMREMGEESRTAALRHRGQSQFRELVSSGQDPMEALRTTAVDLYAGYPGGLGNALMATREPKPMLRSVNGSLVEVNPDGTVKTLMESTRIDPMTKAELDEIEANLRMNQREILRLRALGANTATAAPEEKEALNQAVADVNALQKRKSMLFQSQTPSAGMVNTNEPVPTATVAPPSKSPFQEGTVIRHKTTGKRYRIVNGQPVPME